MEEPPLPAGLSARSFPAKLWRLVHSARVRSVRWDSLAQGLLIESSLFERQLLSPAGALGAGAERPPVAPDTFKAKHFHSFVRQLKLYGFHKVSGDAGALLHFRNANFRRGRPDLLIRIQRRIKGDRQRLAAGLEVRRRQRSRLQQPHRAAASCQNVRAASREDSELPPGPSRRCAGAQESEASPAPPEKVFVTSRLLGDSSVEPGTLKFQCQPELIIPSVPIDHPSTSRALAESHSCTSAEQRLPAHSPSATAGSSAADAPSGSAGCAAWTASSWPWNAPGEEELPPLDLDLVLETLEEMLFSSLPERSPFAQGNIGVAQESPGGEPENKAAAEGALPGTVSHGNSSLEPEEPDIHVIYLSRRAALHGSKRPRESL